MYFEEEYSGNPKAESRGVIKWFEVRQTLFTR